MILSLAEQRPQSNRPLCPHQPYAAAEVIHAIRNEMALRLDDWFFRRSATGFAPCHGREALESIANLFAAELDWSPSQRQEQIRGLLQQLQIVAATPAPASSP
jgi:glycerol-3-phosphate dehydrogenase